MDAGANVRELTREPVRSGPGVGVRTCHQAVVDPLGQQTLRGDIHARPPCRARAGSGPIEQREPERQRARGARGDIRGPVRARIEHDDHLELLSRHRLRAQRRHAPGDLLLLVARRDDDDAR